MRVKAQQDGFYRNERIRAGREFVLKDGDKLAKWMQPVNQPAEEKAVKPKAEKPAEEKAVK